MRRDAFEVTNSGQWKDEKSDNGRPVANLGDGNYEDLVRMARKSRLNFQDMHISMF
jgi:hypothetical protein